MANNRIYYACHSVQINGPSGSTGAPVNTDYHVVQGLQSVGLNTNYNLDPVYQLGQLSLYDNYEDIPDVEVTLNKVLDGQPTLYAMCMGTGDLSSLADRRCGVRITVHPDTDNSASGNPLYATQIMPAYLSSVTYTFPVEGNFTEEVTLVANSHAVIAATGLSSVGSVGQRPQADNPNSGAGIARRQLFNLEDSVGFGGRIQNVTVSMDLGREAIYNLGDRIPYIRYINFPVEITTEIEYIETDYIGGTAAESNDTCDNPKTGSATLKIVLCDGTVIDLGSKNKVQSISSTGGDTGGGNMTTTVSYITYNDFTYIGPNDDLNASSVSDGGLSIDYSDVP